MQFISYMNKLGSAMFTEIILKLCKIGYHHYRVLLWHTSVQNTILCCQAWDATGLHLDETDSSSSEETCSWRIHLLWFNSKKVQKIVVVDLYSTSFAVTVHVEDCSSCVCNVLLCYIFKINVICIPFRIILHKIIVTKWIFKIWSADSKYYIATLG